jgi:alpha-D-xyloside xylohydrolase
LRDELGASASGLPVVGSDVGGYSSGLVSDLSSDSGSTTTDRAFPSSSLFVRWAQLGAISPLMEVGGRGRQEQFWNEYDGATVDAFRRAAVLHYELFPYFYELARRAAATGVPILRPLGFSFPDDEEAWAHELEMMVGPDILAAPVVEEAADIGDAAGVTPARVYLPRGSWIDLFAGKPVEGGQTVVRPTPITEIPLYMRSGAVVPFNLREPDVWLGGWRVADLGRFDRAGWMYAPGRGTTVAGSGSQGSFRAGRSGRSLGIRLGGARREVQVLVLSSTLPRSVMIDGRRIAVTTPTALRAHPQGWTMKTGAFGGIVLKLAPSRGRSRIDIVLT